VRPVRTIQELARVLWRYALQPWIQARPGTVVETPVFGAGRVDFRVHGPGGDLGLRVSAVGGSLAVAPEGPISDPVGLDELSRLVMALAERGLRLTQADQPARRLELFIASGCNLACRFCCEADRIERREFMAWEDIEIRLQEAVADGVQVIQFMGGEATLHPQFPNALRRAKELGLGTYVITNLLKWEDPRWAATVAPLLDEVMISVHAHSAETGAVVTQRPGWWRKFVTASVHARATLGSRRRCSTVLTRHNVSHLDALADIVLSFEPQAWVFGTPVPVRSSAERSLADALSLTEQRALAERFQALSERAAAQHCRLVFFSIPHCVLPPSLRDQTHDGLLDHQDLGDDAVHEPQGVNFWSEADYQESTTAVALGRRRTTACQGCERRAVCGGHFGAYLDRHGDAELWPITDGVATALG